MPDQNNPITSHEELATYLLATAEDFGAKIRSLESKDTSSANAVFRKNLEKKPYLGFIDVEQELKGVYRDSSFVVFVPSNTSGCKQCVVAFALGSDGFQNDYDKTTLPGVRRVYRRLIAQLQQKHGVEYYAACKADFGDTESSIDSLPPTNKKKAGVESDSAIDQTLSDTVNHYSKCIFASMFIPDYSSAQAKEVLMTWLALYAKFRGWPNKTQKEKIRKLLSPQEKTNSSLIEETEVKELLEERHYVVLQGAPGTGKSRLTSKLAEGYKNGVVLFTQMHAETSYSDFVYGILPDVSSIGDSLRYIPHKGVLYQALEALQQGKKVLLIIDEINRANLSHVLGEAFYLFERDCSYRDVHFKIGDIEVNQELFGQIEKNLYVLATMNTSDRSLAVIDFALRRRFAWYTLRPHNLYKKDLPSGKCFHTALFEKFDAIFEEYATDEELNLQPGHSFFMTAEERADEAMKKRMKYELLPLIKEYLQEGYLSKAKNEFCQLFSSEIQCDIYE